MKNNNLPSVTITKNNALEILIWIERYSNANWGIWGNYPKLPVGATYLSYDSNNYQINLSSPIEIGYNYYDCITDGSPVGAKWNSPLRSDDLMEAFDINYDDVRQGLGSLLNEERRNRVDFLLKRTREIIANGEYMPIIHSIEAVYLKSERKANDNYTAPIGIVHVGETIMLFTDIVEWRYIGKRGKNGPNKKNVYAPIIPDAVQAALNKQLEIEIDKRMDKFRKDVAMYEADLNILSNG